MSEQIKVGDVVRVTASREEIREFGAHTRKCLSERRRGFKTGQEFTVAAVLPNGWIQAADACKWGSWWIAPHMVSLVKSAPETGGAS